jgi:hypothetical protein
MSRKERQGDVFDHGLAITLRSQHGGIDPYMNECSADSICTPL